MQKKPINIEFQLKGIDLLSLNLPGVDENAIIANEIEFDITLEQKIDTTNELVIVACTIKAHNLGKEFILGSIKVACLFHLKSMDTFLSNANGTISLPSKFIETINIVTIGVARGMMFSEFRGTYLNNVILPLVDPSELSDVKINSIKN